MDESGFFAQIPQHEVDCRGQPVRMPLFYRRSRMLQAGVAMHTAQVEPLLPSPRLHPLRIAPGRCLMVVAVLQYTETDIGPYDEVLVGFPCTLDHVSPQFVGTLRHLPESLMVVHWLGVSTERALQAGDQLLYTRKFMAQFAFEDGEEGWVNALVSQGGQGLLRLGMRPGEARAIGRERHAMLSIHERHLLRWDFLTSEHVAGVSQHGGDALLEWGPHPKGREMARLDLGGIVEARHSARHQAILGPILESYACERPA